MDCIKADQPVDAAELRRNTTTFRDPAGFQQDLSFC